MNDFFFIRGDSIKLYSILLHICLPAILSSDYASMNDIFDFRCLLVSDTFIAIIFQNLFIHFVVEVGVELFFLSFILFSVAANVVGYRLHWFVASFAMIQCS